MLGVRIRVDTGDLSTRRAGAAVAAQPLANPLDPCVDFLSELRQALEEDRAEREVSDHLLDAVRRACRAQGVFVLRQDGDEWILKADSPSTGEPSHRRRLLESTVRDLAGVLSGEALFSTAHHGMKARVK